MRELHSCTFPESGGLCQSFSRPFSFFLAPRTRISEIALCNTPLRLSLPVTCVGLTTSLIWVPRVFLVCFFFFFFFQKRRPLPVCASPHSRLVRRMQDHSDKGKTEEVKAPKIKLNDKPAGGTPAMRRVVDEATVVASPGQRRLGVASPGMRRLQGTPGTRRANPQEEPAFFNSPAPGRVTQGQLYEPEKKKKGFFSAAADLNEEELTPYQNWTTGELAPNTTGIDVGLRARAARETGPGGTGTGYRGGGAPAPQYLGPEALPGETREEREMRFFLARGEGTKMLENPDAARNVLGAAGAERLTTRGTVRPGSQRPGTFRSPGPVRPAGITTDVGASRSPGPVRPAGMTPAPVRAVTGTPGPVRNVTGTPGVPRNRGELVVDGQRIVRPADVVKGTPGPVRPAGFTPAMGRPAGLTPAMGRAGGVEGDLRRNMFADRQAPVQSDQLDIGQQFNAHTAGLDKPPQAGAGEQLSPYENWDGKLAPTAAARRTVGYTSPIQSVAPIEVPREDIFQGVSTKARTTVFQFIWELKLRVFSEGEILEQELRKDPEERVFLKLIQPKSMDALRKRSYDSWPMKALHFVDGTMPAFSIFCRRHFILMLLDALLRGSGQVMMCNNPIGGAIAIGAIFATSGWIGVMACFGLLCSTLTAYFLGVNRAAWQGGLFGYNGLLLGAACGNFMAGPWNALTIPIVFVGSTFTSILNLAFGNMLAPIFGAPPLALAFVFMTWIVLGGMFGWQNFNLLPGTAGRFPGPKPGEVTFNVNEAFQAWMRGCGAIYFAGTTWSGVMMVVAMSFFSRISAIMMLCGSMVGLFAAWMAGVNVAEIYGGGYSYDAALAAIGIGGLFYVISWKVSILAMMAAWFATWLHSALGQWLAPVGLPALNLGFDLTVIFFVMIQFSLSGIAVIPLAKISQPEAHYYKTRSLAATLRALAAIEEMKAEQQAEREALFYEDLMHEQELQEQGNDVENPAATTEGEAASTAAAGTETTGAGEKKKKKERKEGEGHKDDYDSDDSL